MIRLYILLRVICKLSCDSTRNSTASLTGLVHDCNKKFLSEQGRSPSGSLSSLVGSEPSAIDDTLRIDAWILLLFNWYFKDNFGQNKCTRETSSDFFIFLTTRNALHSLGTSSFTYDPSFATRKEEGRRARRFEGEAMRNRNMFFREERKENVLDTTSCHTSCPRDKSDEARKVEAQTDMSGERA